MIATNVPTARRTTRLSAPGPVCASQVKASHLGSPPSAPGPGPVRRLCLYLPSSPRTVRRMRNLLAREAETRGRIREDGGEDVKYAQQRWFRRTKHEEAAAGNRGDGWFFDLFLPPQVVRHPFIRGWFLRNLPVHVPSGRLLKEHHVALLSLTTRGPY